MIAEVIPAAIAMVRNALLMPSRFGRPKLTFEAPQEVLTLSSVAQPVHQAHDLHARLVDGADRHHQRIDHDVAGRDAVIHRALDDLLRHREAHVGILGDAGLIVRDRDHRGAVLLDQRQHHFQPLLLAGHRIHQRLALVDREPGLERRDDRGIDRQRHVGDRLHQLDGLREDRRLVRQRDARVHIEHVRAGFHLGARVGLDAAEVAGRHFGREDLAAGGIDALADDDEGAVEADDDFPGGGTDNGIGHDAFL